MVEIECVEIPPRNLAGMHGKRDVGGSAWVESHFQVAVTGGIWCGLAIWAGPTVGGLLLGLAKIFLAVDGWVVLVAVAGMVLYCVLAPPEWNGLGPRANPAVLLAVGVGNLLILAWKHRADLARPFAFRPWLTQRRSR